MKKSITVLLSILALAMTACTLVRPQALPLETSTVNSTYEETRNSNEESTPSARSADTATSSNAGSESEAPDNDEAEIVEAAIRSAEEYIIDGDFDQAMKAIAEANHIVSGKESKAALMEEKDRINSLRPVPLRTMTMLSGSPDINGVEKISTGESDHCIGMTIYDIEAKKTLRRSISYYTHGEYDYLEGRLSLMGDSSKNTKLQVFIELYCDGILTYTSKTVTRGSLPIEIKADIKGSDLVEIKFAVQNPLSRNYSASDWSKDTDYPVSFALVEPVFCPKYTPRQ